MRVVDFDYELPPDLIAQAPLAERSASRLLVLEQDTPEDRHIRDCVDLFRPGDVLVMNDTRVIPARLYGAKASGGQVEVLIERIETPQIALALIRSSKSPRSGTRLRLEDSIEVEVLGRDGLFFRLSLLNHPDFLSVLHTHGHIPLPPYIGRAATPQDRERYQTIYARKEGSVAAPTAGLHFDQALLDRIQAQGVHLTQVTLHVGAGTFQPVRVEDTRQHHMHAEYTEVTAATCSLIEQARAQGGRVIAVGTTSMRSLESAAPTGYLQPMLGATRLFITPGYRFRVVDRLLTNFHLPQSTLMMLVTAFGGYQRVMRAYRHAIAQRYRFFSYGDAMWLAPGATHDLPPSVDHLTDAHEI